MITTQDIIIRLLAAVLFSGAVGLQRALTGKAAGMRTHILVGVGSAIFTLVSGYAFHTTASNADRIAAQVVTGIGFIGGGTILKERGSIRGLTTAAGLWASAALGMAAAAALYTVGFVGVIIIILTLVALRRLELRFPRRRLETWSIHIALADGATLNAVRSAIAPYCRRTSLAALAQAEATSLVLSVEVPHHFDIMAITEALRAAGARTVRWQATGDAEVEEGP